MARSLAERRLSQEQGVAAEAYVAELLASRGWALLARNWRCPAGELDLVLERSGKLRFIEVKARAVGDGSGLEAIDREKQRRIARAAEAFLAELATPWEEAAFTVVEVIFGEDGWQVEILDDAFDAP